MPDKDKIRHNDISRKIKEDTISTKDDARSLFNRAAGINHKDSFSSEPEPIKPISPFLVFSIGIGIVCLVIVVAFFGYLIVG